MASLYSPYEIGPYVTAPLQWGSGAELYVEQTVARSPRLYGETRLGGHAQVCHCLLDIMWRDVLAQLVEPGLGLSVAGRSPVAAWRE